MTAGAEHARQAAVSPRGGKPRQVGQLFNELGNELDDKVVDVNVGDETPDRARVESAGATRPSFEEEPAELETAAIGVESPNAGEYTDEPGEPSMPGEVAGGHAPKLEGAEATTHAEGKRRAK